MTRLVRGDHGQHGAGRQWRIATSRTGKGARVARGDHDAIQSMCPADGRINEAHRRRTDRVCGERAARRWCAARELMAILIPSPWSVAHRLSRPVADATHLPNPPARSPPFGCHASSKNKAKNQGMRLSASRCLCSPWRWCAVPVARRQWALQAASSLPLSYEPRDGAAARLPASRMQPCRGHRAPSHSGRDNTESNSAGTLTTPRGESRRAEPVGAWDWLGNFVADAAAAAAARRMAPQAIAELRAAEMEAMAAVHSVFAGFGRAAVATNEPPPHEVAAACSGGWTRRPMTRGTSRLATCAPP